MGMRLGGLDGQHNKGRAESMQGIYVLNMSCKFINNQ